MASISDMLAPALQIGSTILSAGSSFARGAAGRQIAARRKAALDFEAEQLDQEAVQSRGIGMRTAQNEAVKTELVNSSALARAAASGAGASDPTVISILARTAGQGADRQAIAMYEGEAQARLDTMRAAAARFEGQAGEEDAATAQKFANIGGASTILSGGAQAMSMFDKYWAGPKSKFDTGVGNG